MKGLNFVESRPSEENDRSLKDVELTGTKNMGNFEKSKRLLIDHLIRSLEGEDIIEASQIFPPFLGLKILEVLIS